MKPDSKILLNKGFKYNGDKNFHLEDIKLNHSYFYQRLSREAYLIGVESLGGGKFGGGGAGGEFK